jgi:aminoglycoside phosphotransferase (APT) family kinase protein
MAPQSAKRDRLSDLAARVVAEHLSEPVHGVRPIVGHGSQNRVFVVTTARQQVVVRMSADSSALDRYMKERWCIEHAAACGVPGPLTLDVGNVEQFAYMLQTFDPGEHVASGDGAASRVWRQLGHYARSFHGIAVCGFGDQLSDFTHGSAARTWSRAVRYNIEQLCDTDPLRRMGVVTGAQSKLLRTTFEALANRQFRCGLCHGDLALRNVLVDAAGTVRLLDWGCA